MPNIIPNPTEIKIDFIDFIDFYYLLFIVRRDVKHAIFGTSRII